MSASAWLVIASWIVVVVYSISLDDPAPVQGAEDVNWDDITPTSDQALLKLARIHSTVHEQLTRATIDDFVVVDESLKKEKTTLRKINISQIDDEAEREALMALRREQIRVYTKLRLRFLAFVKVPDGERATALRSLVRSSRSDLSDFSNQLANFAEKASILEDEVKDFKVLGLVFGASSKAGSSDQSEGGSR